MANTMKLINSQTVGSGGASTITFSSIPQTYSDLVIKLTGRNSTTEGNVLLSFNGSTADFTSRLLYGQGASASYAAYTDSRGLLTNYSTAISNAFSSSEIYIPNYTSSNQKCWSSDSTMEDNIISPVYMFLYGGNWAQTAAITSIGLTAINSSSFTQNTTAYLYGISNS